MSEMIEAKDAKKLLNCDDATLNNHINSGAIRAQRQGGKLMLNKDDVAKLSKDKDDDGTIVLTGDSDDLSIDLGKVVDDSAETMVQNKAATDSASGTESITFGEELEVVSFDDHHTSELVFDETKQTGQVQNLSFTDSNTAVMTAVDETSVGATTAPIDFQTGSASAVQEPRGRGESGGSSRRSARSQRVEPEEVKVHWIWPTLLIATAIFMLGFAMPYYVLAMYPKGDGLTDASKGVARGLADNGWTKMASSIAGFTVEPNKEVWAKNPDNAGVEYVDIKAAGKDPHAEWRFKKYLNGKATVDERLKDFTVTAVEGEGDAMSVSTSPGNKLPVRKVTPVGVPGAEQPAATASEYVPVASGLYGAK